MNGMGKRSGFVLSLLVVTVMVLTVGVAGAATYTWNFSGTQGALPPSVTFFDTTNTYPIVATGFFDVGAVIRTVQVVPGTFPLAVSTRSLCMVYQLAWGLTSAAAIRST